MLITSKVKRESRTEGIEKSDVTMSTGSNAWLGVPNEAQHASWLEGGESGLGGSVHGWMPVSEDMLGRKYLLASFHGDTNGLATLPVRSWRHERAIRCGVCVT